MLDKNTEISVLNFSHSPVSVSTRDMHYLIPGGSEEVPAVFPMTLSELIYVNSISEVFRVGVLFFDPEVEAEVYAALRIKDWEKIYRVRDIDDILLNPTVEKLEEILNITSTMYFNRIYGEFVALRNSNLPISGSIDKMMTLRRKELMSGQPRTNIKVKDTVDAQVLKSSETQKQMDDMAKEIEELKALLREVKTDKPAVNKPKKSTSTKSKPNSKNSEAPKEE